MADAEATEAEPTGAAAKDKSESKGVRRIPGNLPYMTNHGTLKAVLDKIIVAAKPEKFSQDYLATVLGYSGGSSRAVLPILKRVGFLTSDGTPTEIYSKFRTESGRAEAVYRALRNGFAEIFRRSDHAYAANDAKLSDLVVETTGLKKDDPVARAIRGTFRVFTGYLPAGFTPTSEASEDVSSAKGQPDSQDDAGFQQEKNPPAGPLGLAYHINVVLPETRDVEVYNNIFRSLRENLLRT